MERFNNNSPGAEAKARVPDGETLAERPRVVGGTDYCVEVPIV